MPVSEFSFSEAQKAAVTEPVNADGLPKTSSAPSSLPGPWPWYAYAFLGLLLPACVSWLMVAGALFLRGRRGLACALALASFSGDYALVQLLSVSPAPWHRTILIGQALNLVMALGAFAAQRWLLGPSARRLQLTAWRSWLVPLGIGLLLGLCLGFVHEAGEALALLKQLSDVDEPVHRNSVLWLVFAQSWHGLGIGLVLGLWWAGEGDRFGVRHIVCFCVGYATIYILWSIFFSLYLYLVNDGLGPVANPVDSLQRFIPLWTPEGRWFRAVIRLETPLTIGLLALLLGAPGRIRDFGRRLLLLPVIYGSAVFLNYSPVLDAVLWDPLSDRLNSPLPAQRSEAFEQADQLLTRYPDMVVWPWLASKAAGHWYAVGDTARARQLYERVATRCAGSPRWSDAAVLAATALRSPSFGDLATRKRLSISAPDYEEYLTPNWMALLAAVRFWENGTSAESQTKARLQTLSRSHEYIELYSLPGLAELDDAARNLGYEFLVLRTERDAAKALLDAGFPVLLQRYGNTLVLDGYDAGRRVVMGYDFSRLPARIRTRAREAFQELLSLAPEGGKESHEQQARIGLATETELSFAAWDSPGLRYAAPFMAVVYPSAKAADLAAALGTPLAELRRLSDACLAGLIAIAFVEHGDPSAAVTRAQQSARVDPLGWQAGHLARLFHARRTMNPPAAMPLERSLPVLAQVQAGVAGPAAQPFLKQAEQEFLAGIERLPWLVAHRAMGLLDPSDATQRALLTRLAECALAADGNQPYAWRKLATACAFAGDTASQVRALEGLVGVAPENAKARLDLVRGYVRLDRMEQARASLEHLDPEAVAFDGDYPFCRGAVAEWEGRAGQALAWYERAIDLRRYQADYFLYYGRLLDRQGRREAARKALAWAAQIDAEGRVRNEALSLLGAMGAKG